LGTRNNANQTVGIVSDIPSLNIATVVFSGVISLTGNSGEILYLDDAGNTTLTPSLPPTLGKLVRLGSFIATNTFLVNVEVIGVG
jgi:hypothetical protein